MSRPRDSEHALPATPPHFSLTPPPTPAATSSPSLNSFSLQLPMKFIRCTLHTHTIIINCRVGGGFRVKRSCSQRRSRRRSQRRSRRSLSGAVRRPFRPFYTFYTPQCIRIRCLTSAGTALCAQLPKSETDSSSVSGSFVLRQPGIESRFH